MLSYEELYEKYATDVLRVSYFYLGDRQRAEDVCQDVFVRLMTNAPDLQEAIHELPPTFREAILLYYYQGYGIGEIAQMLDLPEGTISSRLSRARKKLESILKEEGGLSQ